LTGAVERHRRGQEILGASSHLQDAGIPNTVVGDTIVISLRDQVSFPQMQSTLDDKGRSFLIKVGTELYKQPGVAKVIVQGHADKVPFKGDEFGNYSLSVDRAKAVLRFLYQCEDCGYNVNDLRRQLTLSGVGDLDAAALTTDELKKTGVEGDRRVDIILDFRGKQ
jgi:flagellar motor protein MotB